ncbi:MAG: hypothetical protein ABJF10_28705 [Chthoniobacter sp.]|uniref:hypothetical protein n=1 Tax=Chthoniobacter sp. TaxID=2510640 RepID=UPI0032ACC6DC
MILIDILFAFFVALVIAGIFRPLQTRAMQRHDCHDGSNIVGHGRCLAPAALGKSLSTSLLHLRHFPWHGGCEGKARNDDKHP